MLGSAVTRVEDRRLVTGQGRFLDDLGADALAAAFVRSPHAHALVLDVDASDSVDVEGLVAVYTWEDLPGRAAQPIPVSLPHPGLIAPRTGYALANGEVNHLGEPVVMVVARDRYIAEDAAERIRVTYEPLAPVVGIEAARHAETRVHDDVPDNVAGVIRQECGDVDAALAAAPHVLDLNLDIERSMAAPLEGRGVLARVGEDGRLVIHTSTQVPHAVRAVVAHLLGLADADVDVVTPDIGGAFGLKGVRPWPEEILVPLAARLLRQPVKWVEDRRENFIASAQERAQRQHVRVGFDDTGRVLGYDIDICHDIGAYSQYGLVVSQNTSSHLLGPYAVPAKRATVTALYTNLVMVAPYRGAGRPEAVFAVERMMDRVADHLGMDRAAVREVNLIPTDQLPYGHGFRGQDGREVVYDSGDYAGALKALKDLVDWDDFEGLRAAARREGRTVGIGLAAYVENTGLGPYEGARVHLAPNGRVSVATGITSQGQGHETVLAQVVASELGVALGDVDVTTGDTRGIRYGVGTYASRGAVVAGSAVARAARKIKERALQLAADALEADPDDLELVDGVVRVKGTPSVALPLRTVAALSNPLRYSFDEEARNASRFARALAEDQPPLADEAAPGLESLAFHSPVRSTFANGIHAVVVETDPRTAEIRILRYCVVHDCGRVINPLIVEGQIHGGVAQGVGGSLYERMAYDQDGQLLNASFMDFLMPYATEVPPHIEIDHLESPSPLNPLGVKGAGEAGVIPAAAAIASAIEDAEGFRIEAMPLSPDGLFRLRQLFAAGEIEPLRRERR
ncbi:aerobic carbon-monoxide dehydrogenase large subunit [Blastococcus mobilis]|uniref:CO or xanthine dehydrogenase, Mo-binding subunit n=1 Tax=Blastococcus mobilis TaxID=1938746 RepID=A0A238WKB1_9ACTN|nr:aerobic carbon-monoxide dehydrogenase large subunit [Blastococcus mobilis]SNR46684.1 CO or xanthine dehydrogenase, Mo-binding subunit [Blastococcus mobilis]